MIQPTMPAARQLPHDDAFRQRASDATCWWRGLQNFCARCAATIPRRASLLLLFVFVLGIEASCQSNRSIVVPGEEWKQLPDPEKAGWSPAKLAEIDAYVQQIGSSSAMIVQHGVVVAAWGDVTNRSNLHSCRKSLLSALIGMAVAEKKIDLDDTLEKLGIDDSPPALSPLEKKAMVRDLLEARSGVYHAAAYETKEMLAEKPPRYSHSPGTFWYYNNWDFNTLGYIYEQAVGAPIFRRFYLDIARPIGMQDFTPTDGSYISTADSRYPAYPINMSARDLARFALLYLRGGKWNNTQVVPEDWVKASTRPYSDSPSGGYGYLWWTGDSASGAPGRLSFPKGSFWAEGYLGQYAVVVPSLDLIVVNRLDERMSKRNVGKDEISRLVAMVVAAASPN